MGETKYWTLTANELPPEKELVETLSPNGLAQDLKYYHGLWWLPDMSLYIYYTPQFWRRKEPKGLGRTA